MRSIARRLVAISSTVLALFAFVLVWSTLATAVETPAAGLYRALTDLCLDRYLRDKDLNEAQLNTGRPLIVHCDCMARFLFFYMDAEAIHQLEVAHSGQNYVELGRCCSKMRGSNSPLAP